MWNITMQMMDAAKAYIEATNSITFRYDSSSTAIPLALRIREANGENLTTPVVKVIADKVLLKVANLMAA